MGSLHFIGGEKGGVGKSFTSRLLAQYMVDHHLPFVGFDSDGSHATFSRFYGQFTSPVIVDDFESLDQIIDEAEQNPEGNIIVDLAAQTAQKLGKWIEDCDLAAIMAELGYTVYFWHVMDDSADAVFLLDKALDKYSGANVRHVVVENHGRASSFKNFESSPVYTKARETGAGLVTLARLHEGLAQKIDFNNYSFWAAANSRQCMKIAEAQRVKVWLNHAYRQIEAVLAPAQTPSPESSL